MVLEMKAPHYQGIKHADMVYVMNREPRMSAHGVTYQPISGWMKVICSVEDRAQQAGMFSISGAEDKTPQDQGGLTEVTPIQILANEWPGDIYSYIWFAGGYYDADGAPVHRRNGTRMAQGWEVKARRVAYDPKNLIPEPVIAEGAKVYGDNSYQATHRA